MMGNKTPDLLASMEANFLAYFIIGLVPLPHMQLYSDPELTWAVSTKLPNWNTVLRTRLAVETTAARVEAMLHRFKTSNTPLGWLVLPSTRPVNLASYLLANGMKQVENRPHMLADLHKLPTHLGWAERLKRASLRSAEAPGAVNPPLLTPPGLTIELVLDDASFARWYQATMAGFEMSPSHAQIYYEAYTRLGFDPAGPFLHYVGSLDGEPVTSSTLLLAENMAGIYDVSTAPAARGRGLGTAITLAPLLEARTRGYRYSCLQSSTKGYNVYRRLGFETQYHEKIFAL